MLEVERPVDSDVTPDWAVEIPVEVEVESDETLLLVVERPVDNDVTPD
jgi:hypothetical protein